jgi:hypothetical protein
LFGWVLTIAGYLSSAIFDDALVRLQLRRMTWPSTSCLVWGLLYYIWMALIAVATFEYKVNRVGDAGFTMNQGYWFAYVSSTVSFWFMDSEAGVRVWTIDFLRWLTISSFSFLDNRSGRFVP